PQSSEYGSARLRYNGAEISSGSDGSLVDGWLPPMSETPHILVVDDDERIAKIVEINLRRAGYRVSIARDGEQALAAVAAEVPDLVLLDVTVPLMAGVGTPRRPRS